MKEFKGYTEGAVFKGVMKFEDIIELQNKILKSLNSVDKVIRIQSGINATISDTGSYVTEGILLWGGFPATFKGASDLPLVGKRYFTIVKSSQDKRSVTYLDTTLDYYAYEYYEALLTEEFNSNGTYIEGKEVISCIPFIFTVDDNVSELVLNNSIEGEEGDVVLYNGKGAIILKAGEDTFLQTKGAVIGDQSLADKLGGNLLGNIVLFGNDMAVQSSTVTLKELSERGNIPVQGLLVEILSLLRKSVNDLKRVSFTSDYNDLENKLTMANELVVNLNEAIFTEIPLEGSIRTILSLLVAAVNQIKEIAFSSNYQDLLNAPYKLSDITNDLQIPDEEPIGAVKFMSSNGTIPPGWAIADGTNGTLDLSDFKPDVEAWTEFYDSEDQQFIDSEGQPYKVKVPALQAIQKISSGKNRIDITVDQNLGTVGTTPLCGNIEISLEIVTGRYVDLYARPKGSNQFKSWNNGESTENPIRVYVDSDKTYKAYFTKMFTVIVNTIGPTSVGAVASSLDGEWRQSFKLGVEGSLTLYAQKPDDSYSFNGFYKGKEILPFEEDGNRFKTVIESIDSDLSLIASYSARPTLNIDINPNGAGEVSFEEGHYSVGQVIEITATPKGINKFKSFEWVEDGVRRESTDNPLMYSIREGINDIDVNFQEVFAQVIRTENNSSDRGQIKFNDSELQNKIIENVDKGTIVNIEAVSSEGWRFSHWNSTTKNPLGFENKMSYIVESSEEVVAFFSRIYYKITIEQGEGGSAVGSGSYEYGTNVVVEAIPDQGFKFTKWIKIVNGEEEDYSMQQKLSIDIEENLVLRPVFSEIENTVDITVVPEGTGVVEGEGKYSYGSFVRIKATPATNYAFEGWYENQVRVSSLIDYQFVILRDYALEARFVRIQKKVILTVSPSGAGTVSGDGNYDQGSNAVIKASPVEGYRFIGWYEGKVLVSSESSYTFLVNRDIALEARFEMIVVKLELEVNDELMGVVSGGGSFTFGQVVTILATPRAGYQFKHWKVKATNEVISTESTYLFKLIGNVILVAVFESVSYQINVRSSNVNYGIVTGGGVYKFNSSATVKAIPSENRKFIGWYENSEKVSDSAEYSFIVTDNRELIAQFE